MKSGLPDKHGLSDLVTSSSGLLPQIDGVPFLTDAQFEALHAGVASGKDVLVSAPTSTGKTLIGWWTIASAVEAGGRAVYLVSHRALAKQKFEEAQRLFSENLLHGDLGAIVCATGDGVEDASGRKTNAPLTATILIATYEKFLGCLSTGGPLRDLTDTCFVCDEVQLIGDATRGRNVELLLTLLRRSGWRQFVGLSAVLSEGDAQSLAKWLSLKLVRNPVREKTLRIQCRAPGVRHSIATGRDFVGELISERQEYSRSLNHIITELLRIRENGPVIVFCMKVDATYEHCDAWMQGKTPHAAPGPSAPFDISGDLLRALQHRSAFHNAELSEDERLYVEENIASGAVDVVFATSTLAAGVNFPFGSAVFSDWRRWNFERGRHEPISSVEFQNMAGRVGRMGQAAEEGIVILTADGGHSASQATALMDFRQQDELGTGITPEDFGSLILQLFAGRLAASRNEAFGLICSTLSAAREDERNRSGLAHWEVSLNNQIDRLLAAGCLIESRTHIAATAFGISVARTGLKPETALFFIERIAQNADNLASILPTIGVRDDEDDLLFVLSHAALSSPEFGSEGGPATRHVSWRVSRPNLVSNSYARRLDRILWERPWAANVSAANGALLVTSWGAGQVRANLDRIVPGVRLGTIETLARDVAWILTGMSEILAEITSPVLADESKPAILRGSNPGVDISRKLARVLRRQASRIGLGLPSECLWIASVDLQGPRRRLNRTQILSLRHQGLVKAHELMDGSSEADQKRRLALSAEENPSLANNVRDAVRRWKTADHEFFRKAHAKRAKKVGGEDVVNALYTSKGTDLENAFGEAMSWISVQCTKIDDRGQPARPDFVIGIENFSPIVVEIKSKQSDHDFVPLNSVTEVLSASELIGMRDNFCLTLCSAAVEPSVPSVIESCGRLSAVNIADFVEALLRTREGVLTREGLYNWLTTPGIALKEDIPHT